MSKPESIHRVTVKSTYNAYTDELEPVATFTCEELAAACHKYPDCDCDYWDEDHAIEHGAGHERQHHEECWLVGWFENDAAVYAGDDSYDMRDNGLPDGMNRTGLITVSFEDDYVEWEFTA